MAWTDQDEERAEIHFASLFCRDSGKKPLNLKSDERQ